MNAKAPTVTKVWRNSKTFTAIHHREKQMKTDSSTFVLLIEDDDVDAQRVQRALSGKSKSKWLDGNYRVLRCETLQKAIRTITERVPDVILSDLNLPDSQSCETIERIRNVASDVPVIALTGMDDHEMALKVLRYGGADYICKSNFKDDALGRAMRYALERNAFRHMCDLPAKKS